MTLRGTLAIVAAFAAAWCAVDVARRMRPAVPMREPVVDHEPFFQPECEGDVPPREMEHGGASLRLRLVSDVDGAPVAMPVRLWRLGVGWSGEWTCGDEVRAALDVPVDGVTFPRLPAGRYRLQCLDTRRDAQDPPEFALSGVDTVRVARVASRRTFRQRVRLTDESGVAIGTVTWRSRSESTCGTSDAMERRKGIGIPAWAVPRTKELVDSSWWWLPAWPSIADEHWSVVRRPTWGGRVRPPAGVSADGDIDLGTYLQRGLLRAVHETFTIAAAGHVPVDVDVDDDSPTGADLTFVGVSPHPDALLAQVTRPDGGSIEQAHVEMRTAAVLHEGTPPADVWRTIPVHVRVDGLYGFQPLEFDWTAATADAPHVLVPYERAGFPK
jgi:hypothetical protein